MKAKFYVLLLSLASTLTGMAQIDGYFRVKTAASENDNYMAVTGSFTANASYSTDDLLNLPGSVFYITATQDGVLGNLAAQGIDLAKDTYEGEFADLMDDAISAKNPLYGMVHQGYRYGYTSVARATLGFAFRMVANRLENYGNKVDGYTKGEFEAVTAEFNEKVVRNLDMHLRLTPVEGAENTFNIFVDMPDFQSVVDWYAKDDGRFYRATVAMNKYLLGDDAEYMIFMPYDLSLMRTWGYDYTKDHADKVITVPAGNRLGTHDLTEDTQVYTYTFDEVFSNKELLFNWVKLFAIRMMRPDLDEWEVYTGQFSNSTIGSMLGDMVGLMKTHNITRFLLEQMEAFQPDSRIYFVAGNVIKGTYNADENVVYDPANPKYNEEGFHLGFAVGDAALAAAGANGQWVLTPLTDADEVVDIEFAGAANGNNYAAKIFDFPLKSVDEGTALYTIGQLEEFEDFDGNVHHLVNFIELDDVAAVTPFIVEVAGEGAAQLRINYTTTLGTINPATPAKPEPQPVPEPEPEPEPEPGSYVTVSDEEIAIMRSRRRTGEATGAAEANSNFRGSLLETSADNLKSQWGDDTDKDLYTFGNADTSATDTDTSTRDSENTAFVKANSGAGVAANTAVYAAEPGTKLTNNQVLVGQTTFKNAEDETVTGVEDIKVENAAAKTLFDLQGRPVAVPEAGQVYIINGKKVLVL